ncbi:MAG: hypothetical protein JWL82_217 [Parcubacteria group bacterium]|nr:hypothetical protein [Parcubacteria group bacterium]
MHFNVHTFASGLALLCAGVAGYFLYAGRPTEPPVDVLLFAPNFSANTNTNQGTNAAASTVSSSSTLPLNETPRIVPAGMREYRNSTYRFSLLYPENLAVAVRDEGGGASTITFQNIEKAEGLQIFIVPYSGAQVSPERFRRDEPSGVRTNASNVTIDGVVAAAFTSSNALLGETREIWLIHGGYLYEVTTLKPLDTWLNGIMQTWKFL